MRYLSPRREIEAALPTVVDMLRLRSEGEALSALTQAEIELEETGFDNWDGGTATWTAYLRVPPGVFLADESDAQQITDVMKGISNAYWILEPTSGSPQHFSFGTMVCSTGRVW